MKTSKLRSLYLLLFSLTSLVTTSILGQECGESFYDSGGANGNYANDEIEIYLICPDENSGLVSLEFLSFSIENFVDFLLIYDSDQASEATLIGFYTGVTSPGTITASNPTGCLTVIFSSSESTTDEGWEANVLCSGCSAPFDLTVLSTGSNSATINWNIDSQSSVNSFLLEYKVLGATNYEQINGISNTSTSYELNNLEANTTYEIRVVGECLDGSKSYSQIVNFIGPLSLTCGDTFYDSGGANDNYNNDEFETYIICPDESAVVVTLQFVSFSLENTYDYLHIYNSNETAQTALLGTYTGSNSPGTITATNPSGCLTAIFTSDGSITDTGWEASIICNECFAPTEMNASAITATSAFLDWTIDGQSTATSFLLEYRILGTTEYEQINNISGNSFELTNLEASTTYEVRVAGICPSGSITSFTSTIDFTTLQSLTCGNTFFDSGGANGNYQDDESEIYTICPDNNLEVVTLQFLSFVLESTYDFLYIYDSTEVEPSTLIGVYSGTNSPGIVTSSNLTGCLTVLFTSDGSVTYSGWEANIFCTPQINCEQNIIHYTSSVPSCYGGNNGQIIIDTSAIISPFSIYLNGTLTTNELNDLSTGYYDISIFDGALCTTDSLIFLGQPEFINATYTVLEDLECNNSPSGSITITNTTGGTPPYNFSWSNGNTGNEINNLESGLYYLTIEDSYLCEQFFSMYVPYDPNSLNTWASVDAGCVGEQNTIIDLNIFGGLQPYTIQWSNGSSTEVLTNIPYGEYGVTITDQAGCSLQESFLLNAPSPIDAQIDIQSICGAAEANINISGGNPPYSIFWSNGNWGYNAYGLVVGNYTASVTDQSNCLKTFDFEIETIMEIPETPEIFTPNGTVVCEGDTAVLISNLIDNILWSTGEETQIITVTEPGQYSLLHIGDNECISPASYVSISWPDDAYLTYSTNPQICEGESITLYVNNAIEVNWSNGASGTSLELNPQISTTLTATAVNQIGCVYQLEANIEVIPFQQPGLVEEFLPPDGTNNLSLPVTLSWNTPQYATAFDLYIWEVEDPEPSISDPSYQNLTINSKTIFNLNYNQSYNWKVLAKNNCEEGIESESQIFTTKSLPDLIVQNIDSPPNSAVSNSEVSLEYDIKNNSDIPTGQSSWIERIYISTDQIFGDQNDIYLGSIPNQASLNADQDYHQTVSFMLPQGISGNYFVYVYVDPFNSIAESNETNNGTFSNSLMEISIAPYPDLQIVSLSLPGAGNTIFSGQSGQIQWETANDNENSTADLFSPSFSEKIYLSTTENLNTFNAIYLGQQFQLPEEILIGNSIFSSKEVMIPTNVTGTYFVCIQTDANNHIYEYDYELNNVKCEGPLEIMPLPTPNFSVDQIQVIDEGVVSDHFSIEVVLKNEGSAYQGGLSNRIDFINLDNPAYNQVFYRTLSNLDFESDSNEDFVQNIPIPVSTGQYVFRVFTDSNHSIFEFQGEENNILFSDTITIEEDKIIVNTPNDPLIILIGKPDLQLEEVIVADTLLSGNHTSILYVVKNVGEYPIENTVITDQFRMGTSSNFDEITPLALSNKVINLDVNEIDTIQQVVLIPAAYGGDYFVFARSNFNFNLDENNRFDNNTNFGTSHVLQSDAADLEPIELELFSTSFEIGDQIKGSCEVTNSGLTQVIANYTDKIYLSDEPIWNISTATFLKQFNRSENLIIDTSYVTDFTISIPTTIAAGTYYLYYVTDSENNVYEYNGDELNNVIRSEAITIDDYPPIDLGATQAAAQGVFSSGQTINLNYSAKNFANIPVLVTSWKDALYLSLDNELNEATDILVSEWTVNHSLSAEQAYSKNISATIPYNLALGSYYLFAVIDHDKNHNDSNIGNNNIIVTLTDLTTGDTSTNIGINNEFPPNLNFENFTIPIIANAGQPIPISYTVVNNGLSPITKNWSDKIQLYQSSAQSHELTSILNTDTLEINETATKELSVVIPTFAEGNYFIDIRLNNGSILEEESYVDNKATGFIQVIQPPPCDLVATDISIPAQITSGQVATISWKINNIGSNNVEGYTTTGIYLSTDTTWSVEDKLLETVEQFIGLAPAENLAQEQTICVTDATLQEYHLLVKVDLLNNIIETDDTNNTTASEAIDINVPLLTIGIEEATLLPQEKPIYYRIEIPDSLIGETMQVSLNSSSGAAINELYIAHDEVPTRAVYDFSHKYDFSANQELIVPYLKAGTYYLMSYSNDLVQEITLLAQIIPFEIKTIQADRGGNIGPVTVELTGAKFQSGMSFQLEKEGNIVIPHLALQVVNPTLAYATFDLQDRELGLYAVRGIRLDSAETVLSDAFEIVEGIPAELSVTIDAPEQVRVNRNFSMVITFENIGNVDLPINEKVLIGVDGIPVNLNVDNLATGFNALRIDDDPLNNTIRPGESRSILVYATANKIGQLNFKIK